MRRRTRSLRAHPQRARELTEGHARLSRRRQRVAHVPGQRPGTRANDPPYGPGPKREACTCRSLHNAGDQYAQDRLPHELGGDHSGRTRRIQAGRAFEEVDGDDLEAAEGE